MAEEYDETIRVGDAVLLEVTVTEWSVAQQKYVAKDISTATTLQIKLKKPDLSVVTKTAQFSTTGSDGKMKYQCTTSDIDQQEDWKIQGFVDMPGYTGHTKEGDFHVDPALG